MLTIIKIKLGLIESCWFLQDNAFYYIFLRAYCSHFFTGATPWLWAKCVQENH